MCNFKPDVYLQMRDNCRCVVRDFKWKRFPNHVQYRLYQAYRPIIIQVNSIKVQLCCVLAHPYDSMCVTGSTDGIWSSILGGQSNPLYLC